MQIAGARIAMTSAHAESRSHTVEESLRVQGPEVQRSTAGPVADTATISNRALAAAASAGTSFCPKDDLDAPTTEEELKLKMIQLLLEQLTGRRFDLKNLREFLARMRGASLSGTADAAAPSSSAESAPSGFGLQYDRVERYTEQESMQFGASGVIRTADGREVEFSVALSMGRSFVEEQRLHLEFGDTRALKDPLILNYGGSAADISSTRFAFDLDANGEADQVPLLGAGSAFLARDLDGNGRVDNGSELFGPKTGSGFGELAALDADHNGWVDANDPGYEQLRLWSPDAEGVGTLSTLADRGVGAVSVQAIDTPFQVKDLANQVLGQLRGTSVYVAEDGAVRTVQQVDLTA